RCRTYYRDVVSRAGGLRGLDSSLPKLYDSKPSINTKMSYGHFEARMRRKDVEASPSVALLTRDFLTATGAAPSLILLCSLYEVPLVERDDEPRARRRCWH